MQFQQNPMALLFLCDYQAPYGGNFIASLTRLHAALTQRGVPARYLFPLDAESRSWCKQMRTIGMQTLFFDKGAPLYKQNQLLCSILHSYHITILHVHFGCFPLAELAALRMPHLRLILHFHSDFSAGKPPTFQKRFRDVVYRIPERFIGKHRIQKITVSETSAITTPDCIGIHNALVAERFANDVWTREQTRKAYNVAESAILVLVFGWSPYIKGVDVAVNAMQRIHDAGHAQYLLGIICGRAYTAEQMRSFLAERTNCTGEEPWLRLFPPEEDVFRYHHACDVMLSASRSETFSYALLEALYSCKPCVCSDIPGVRWAKRFDTVRFYPVEDTAALSSAISAAAMDGCSESFSIRAQAVSDIVQHEYSIEDWCNLMLSVYGLDPSHAVP
ncbi:MAG: glycosyltransferase family 4 protein [Clostridia bacterium]